MLYLDMPYPIVPVDPGSRKRGIMLGYRHRTQGPRLMLQVAPEYYCHSQLAAGIHVDRTIRFAERKAPTIFPDIQDEKHLFMILTSRLTQDRDCVGNIRAPRTQNVKIIMQAYAQLGTGKWETLVLRARKGDAFYVNWNHRDGSCASNCFYYVAEPDQVYAYPQEHIPELFAGLGVTPPFTIRDHPECTLRLERREWRKLR